MLETTLARLAHEIDGLGDQLYQKNERLILDLLKELSMLAWTLRRARMTDTEFATWLNGLARQTKWQPTSGKPVRHSMELFHVEDARPRKRAK
jgi:hypothetical protein